jgi:hypothetical protein
MCHDIFDGISAANVILSYCLKLTFWKWFKRTVIDEMRSHSGCITHIISAVRSSVRFQRAFACCVVVQILLNKSQKEFSAHRDANKNLAHSFLISFIAETALER